MLVGDWENRNIMMMTSVPPQAQQPPPAKRARTSASPAMSAVIYDPDTKAYTLMARSRGPVETCASVALTLSVPAPDEECSIGMDPIATYRLDFLPEKACVLKKQPELAKASLPCGHGFNALALLYHFAKNSMTCPCCRAGHAGEQMGEQSIPSHIRRFFTKHLERGRAAETREQIASDALAATHMVQHEVSLSFNMLHSLPMTRMVLSLAAYRSMDRSLYPDPMLALELPLTSSLTMGAMESVSYGYSLQQLNLNLRLLPVGIEAFELGVGVRSMHLHEWGAVGLFRTVRFPRFAPPSSGEAVRVIPSDSGDARLSLEVHAVANHATGNPQFARFVWRISVPDFTELILRTSQALAEGGDEQMVAAV